MPDLVGNMSQKIMFYKVIVYNSHIDYLTYSSDLGLNIGDLVMVPIRSKEKLGLIIDVTPEFEAEYEVKNISCKLDISIKPEIVKFLLKFSEYNLIKYPASLKLFLPTNIASSIEKNKLESKNWQDENNDEAFSSALNESQEEVLDKIWQLYKQKKYYASVIEGVTGSGKTEIYFHMTKRIIENGNGQVLILLPEISLTTQIITRAEKFFGIKIGVWNSSVSAKNKKELWENVRENKVNLVIGARSAIFLPFNNLKLIIVDEEHDSSFKQEEQLVYHGRDMAILRAYIEKIGIILGSATISIETYYNIHNKDFHHFRLSNRFGKAALPEIKLINMRETEEKPPKNYYLSNSLKNHIKNNLEKKEQSLLYLNRRGFAPLSLCNACGTQINCKNCSSWMVYHKSQDRLICHYCSYKTKLPDSCPKCETENSIIFCGPGVEKIEEEVKELFPQAKISIMTKDTTSNLDEAKQKINEIVNGEIDIIIGTQLIAKGYNFPELTLVGIIDADIGLKGSDLRAEERTMQLLTQVSGRAGRFDRKSMVLMQTYDVDNPVIDAIKNNDIESFMELELENRRVTNMPPYSKMTAIILSSHDELILHETAKKIVKNMPKHKSINIMGPIKAAIYKLQKSYRMRILISYPRNFNIQHYLQNCFLGVRIPVNVKIKFDIDPITLI